MENQQQSQTRYDAREATEAARHLLSLISKAIPSEHQGHGQSQRQGQSSQVSVHSEMARSFPGFFRGRKRTAPKGQTPAVKAVKLWKPFEVSFFLLGFNVDVTPDPKEELTFMQAGLGKRTASIYSDISHVELSTLLVKTFSRMTHLQDRWLLFKAAGGNGRRKLSVVPLEAEGYTGAILRRASGGGKFVLYIVPLQDELDLTPLPASAPEFALMPKASCKDCNTMMPLQMLALHVEQCSPETQDNDLIFVEQCSSGSASPTCEDTSPQQEDEVQCPICDKAFSASDVEVHASCCGFSPEDSTCKGDTSQADLDHISCEEDVIKWVTSQVDSNKTFDLCVSRENLVERGLKMWKRQKNGGPVNLLKVTFLGEPGVNTGALRKEFLSAMVAGIEERLFEGDEEGKMPKYSINDLDDELFRAAGEIFAVSIAQGGPAPRYLQKWCYDFLVSGNPPAGDPTHSPLIEAIEKADDLTAHTTDILDCGYTGKIDMEHKENIIRAIRLHVTTKRLPMLQQLSEGLKVYDLIKVIQTRPDVCRSLFIAGDNDEVDSHYIVSHLAPKLSSSGSTKKMKEAEILEHFQDFLQELEDARPDDSTEDTLTVSSVMQWMTGQAHRHLLLAERQKFRITVKFDHYCMIENPNHSVCYPTVSACTDTVTFPVAHIKDYESFKTLMQTAIKYGAGFDRV